MKDKDISERGPVILWFRRDLRLGDNLALQAAIATGKPVICVYIRGTDGETTALGAAQSWWLHHSLAALDGALRETGNRLLLLTGDPRHVLETLIRRTGARHVLWNRRYDARGMALDSDIKAALRDDGIDIRSFAGFLLHEPHHLRTKQGKPYSVFTPFWRVVEASFRAIDDLPAPDRIPAVDDAPDGEKLDDWRLLPRAPDWSTGFTAHGQPGEAGALSRLDSFLARASGYRGNRDLPARAATSGLSAHLALGEISPHRIWNATAPLMAHGPSEDLQFLRRELVWRDFAWHMLFHHPDMADVNLDRRFDSFSWQSDSALLRAWQLGATGYPIVDAGMRELWATGFMQNRVRMITASFLIKDLLIDWRIGERWFRYTLVDADMASNAMNWQWVAGSGPDASPWFRIFNPIRQGETFDPAGDYVKRWCPELAALPRKVIHRPFEAPKEVLSAAGVRLGDTYPVPVVNHDQARQRALDAFQKIRSTAVGSD